MEPGLKIQKAIAHLLEIAIATPKVANSKHAAAVIYKGRIVSIGVNSLKTNPFQQKFSRHIDSIYLHAETAAIKNALRHLSMKELAHATLVVCRIKSSDSSGSKWIQGMSKPCSGCQKAIAQFNMKRVYYTLDETGLESL